MKKNTEKKNTKRNIISYKDLPKDHWIRNLGPMIIYSTPSTKSSSETPSSSEEPENNPREEKTPDSDLERMP